MLALVDVVIASAYAFFHSVIGRITSIDELYTIIINCLQYERFQKSNELVGIFGYYFMLTISSYFFEILHFLCNSTISSGYKFEQKQLFLRLLYSIIYFRFIFYYSIIYPIEEVLNRCDGEQKIYINTALEHIRGNCITHILEQLRNRGMLSVSYCYLRFLN